MNRLAQGAEASTHTLRDVKSAERSPPLPIGQLDDSVARPATPLHDRLGFEVFLAELSATFVKVPAELVDSQIVDALRQIVEFLGIDRSGFGELVNDQMEITHSYELPGIPPSPRVILEAHFPSYARKVRLGEPFRLPDDLPPDAVVERDFLSRTGLKSNLTIPLKVTGAVVGGIGFASFHKAIDYPDDLIRRLRLVGDIFTNALARKRADEALQLAMRQAAELRNELAHAIRVELVSHLTATIAHEVNQPLFAIASNAQTALDLLNMGDMEEVKQALTDIWADASRASEVIARVRGLIKKEDPCRDRVRLQSLIDELSPLLYREAASKGATLRIELGAKEIALNCDRVQMQQVLLNLLFNAVEAVSNVNDGAREVTVRVRGDETNRVHITVEDTGVGLSEEDCARVFTPFLTTKSNGLGLGLSISRSLIEAHGGKLWAAPGVGRGAVFHIQLPAATGDPQ
jgi:signal transduction histidine kinase